MSAAEGERLEVLKWGVKSNAGDGVMNLSFQLDCIQKNKSFDLRLHIIKIFDTYQISKYKLVFCQFSRMRLNSLWIDTLTESI